MADVASTGPPIAQLARRCRRRGHARFAHRAGRRPGSSLLFAARRSPAAALLQDLFFVFTMLALAQYWNLLAGYAGLVSVGQQAFVGLGAYALFAATSSPASIRCSPILLAGSSPALLALPTALVVFRLRGAYFAIGTWVVAEVFRLLLAQVKQLGGGTGTSLGPTIDQHDGSASTRSRDALRRAHRRRRATSLVYWLALLLARRHARRWSISSCARAAGLALAAIRDCEPAAESVGVDAFRTKLLVYVLTAFGTGMVGALIYLQKARISPDAAFSVLDWTAYVIFIVVIGGIGTIEGPIVGAIVFYLLQDYLAAFGPWYLMLLGALAIAVMLPHRRPLGHRRRALRSAPLSGAGGDWS